MQKRTDRPQTFCPVPSTSTFLQLKFTELCLVQATWEYRFGAVWLSPLDFLHNSEFYLQQLQNHSESGWKDCSEVIHGRQVVPPAQHF